MSGDEFRRTPTTKGMASPSITRQGTSELRRLQTEEQRQLSAREVDLASICTRVKPSSPLRRKDAYHHENREMTRHRLDGPTSLVLARRNIITGRATAQRRRVPHPLRQPPLARTHDFKPESLPRSCNAPGPHGTICSAKPLKQAS